MHRSQAIVKCALPIIVLAALFLNSGSLRAQHMMIGVKGGTNLASQSLDSAVSSTSTSFHPGLIFGGAFEYWMDDTWALCAQVLYDQKGTHSEMSFSEPHSVTKTNGFYISYFSASESNDISLKYLEIPLMLKVALSRGDVKPYVFAGPSVGMYLGGSDQSHFVISVHDSDGVKGLYTGSTTFDTLYTIRDSEVNALDFSLIFGAGVSYALPSGITLFADAAYCLGLIDVASSARLMNLSTKLKYFPSGDASKVHVKSRDIRITAGVMFPIGEAKHE